MFSFKLTLASEKTRSRNKRNMKRNSYNNDAADDDDDDDDDDSSDDIHPCVSKTHHKKCSSVAGKRKEGEYLCSSIRSCLTATNNTNNRR